MVMYVLKKMNNANNMNRNLLADNKLFLQIIVNNPF